MTAKFYEGPLPLKPIGWMRKQDGLQYDPCWITYASKPAPENGTEPAALFSEDQVRNMLAPSTEQQAAAPACEHRIADARNEVVQSGYVCIDCGAVFAAAGHVAAAVPSDAPAAWMVTRLTRKGDESSGRVRYLHLKEQAARTDYDAWLDVEGSCPAITPLFAPPGAAPQAPQAPGQPLLALLEDIGSLPLHAHKRKVVRDWIEAHLLDGVAPAAKDTP